MQPSTFCTLLTAFFFVCFSSGNPIQIENTLELPVTFSLTSSLAPINPKHYDIAGTDLFLEALEPYGQKLPGHAALVCLSSAVVDLAEKIVESRSDLPLPDGYIFIASGVKVYIQVIWTSGFLMSLAKAALAGVEELMEASGGTGQRSVTVAVFQEQSGIIGRIVVSWVGPANGAAPAQSRAVPGATGAALAASGAAPVASGAVVAARVATNPNDAVTNATSTDITASLTPDHYRIPETEVYVVVIRPYGNELPHDPTINLLLNAARSVQNDRAVQGDVELPMEWSFQESGLFVSFNSRRIHRPLLSTMQAGLIGLFDLMEDDSVVGTKEILFGMGVEGQGDCGSGQVKWVNPAANGNATLEQVASVATSPLGMVALQTGVVGTV